LGEAVQPIFNTLITLAVVAFVVYRRSALREPLPFWSVLTTALSLFLIELENITSLLFTYDHALVHRLLFLLFSLSLLAIVWFLPNVNQNRGGTEP